MNLAYQRLKKAVPRLNEREYTLDDFERIARRERIRVADCPLPDGVRGYYTSTKRRVYRKKWIVFNNRLSHDERLLVGLHELVHHFLHASFLDRSTFFCRAARSFDSRNDLEADTLALVWLIPRPKLLHLTTETADSIPAALVPSLIRRQWILEKYNI